jgi:FtsZ-binding cell division protein ZapB
MKKKTLEQMTLAGSEEEILTRLHERVEKAIATIQELRRERDALQAKLEESERFQKERDEIRNRIEAILANLESLDETAS